MTRVSVLLASCNGATWIGEQVASILAQTDVDVDLVVGDDQSADGTVDAIMARWGNDQRVRVQVWPEPSGSAGANFLRLIRTVDVSQADAVAFADQDDIWWPHKLATGVQALIAADAVGYSSAVEAHWENGRTALLKQSPRVRRADYLFEGAGQGCTFVLDRAFFQKIQLFLNSVEGKQVNLHFHDWLVYVLSRSWGARWVFDQKPSMTYRQHSSNEIGARGRHGFMRRLRLVRNGWYADQINEASTLYVAGGGADPVALRLIADLSPESALSGFAVIRLALRVIRDGRRRLLDRVLLFVAALARWI